MFNILDTTTGLLVVDSEGLALKFSSGKEAVIKIDELKINSDHKFRPAKVVDGDTNWKDRETKRFETGDYLRCDILEKKGLIIPDHFLHLSKENIFSLAYTKSDEKGREDKQTTISVIGYLETYFADKTKAAERNSIKKLHEQEVLKRTVKFAYTPDDIEYVYTHFDENVGDLADSCMRYNIEEFSSHIHPVRVYGAGDLAIAYLANSEGETTHRALVWPEKKIYSRVYGDSQLHDVLKSLGYEKSSYYDEENAKSIKGARLLNIASENDEFKNHLVLPYIDDPVNVEFHEDSQFLLLVGEETGQAEPQDAGGLVPWENYETCSHCEKGKIRGSDLHKVIINEYFDHEMWCTNCSANETFYCNGYETSFRITVTASVPTHTRYDWGYNTVVNMSKLFIDSHKNVYAFCPKSPDRASMIELMSPVYVDDEDTVENWCQQSIVTHSWLCEKTEKRYARNVEGYQVMINASHNGNRKYWAKYCKAACDMFAVAVPSALNMTTYLLKSFLEERHACNDPKYSAIYKQYVLDSNSISPEVSI